MLRFRVTYNHISETLFYPLLLSLFNFDTIHEILAVLLFCSAINSSSLHRQSSPRHTRGDDNVMLCLVPCQQNVKKCERRYPTVCVLTMYECDVDEDEMLGDVFITRTTSDSTARGLLLLHSILLAAEDISSVWLSYSHFMFMFIQNP